MERNAKGYIDAIEKKRKIYLEVEKEDVNIISKSLGVNKYKIKTFTDPLEIQYYRMAEELAEQQLNKNTHSMTLQEQEEYFKYLSKQYIIEKLLKGETFNQ